MIPGAESAESPAPQWMKTLSRWAALDGLVLLLAAWPVWSVVVRPSLGGVWRSGPGFLRRMKRYVLVATVFAIGGSLAALVVQSFAITDGSFLDKVLNTLGQTRYGRLWLVRIAMITLSALVLAGCGWWFVNRRRGEGVAAWTIAAALPIPFSVHLFAASLWIGGLAILAFVLLPGLRGLDPLHRRAVLVITIPRFSGLALISMAAIGVTGFYAGWLHVGNLTALQTTAYGQALIAKLAVLAVILGIAAVNLFVIERRLTRPAAAAHAGGGRRGDERAARHLHKRARYDGPVGAVQQWVSGGFFCGGDSGRVHRDRRCQAAAGGAAFGPDWYRRYQPAGGRERMREHGNR